MRHLHSGRKLNRSGSHRIAMVKNLLRSLIDHGKITTTVPKAKELRRVADRFVTMGKKGDLAARRRAFAWLRNDRLVAKLFADYATRFADRNGGYTRMARLGVRAGDGAETALLEFIPGPEGEAATSKKASPKKAAAGRKKVAADKKKKVEKKKSAPKKAAAAGKAKTAPKSKSTKSKTASDTKTAKSTKSAAKTTRSKTTAKKTVAKGKATKKA